MTIAGSSVGKPNLATKPGEITHCASSTPPFIPQAFFNPHVARKNLTGRTGKMATNHQCGHENNNNASRARSTSACYITSVSQDLTLSLMM
ncbi:hypothetical protein MG398_05780 [Brucella melitensis]|nr:hypothetical protein [Brucella melitensis]